MEDLTAEARLWGLETGYHDVFGQWRAPSAETQRRLIAALSHGYERPPDIAPVGEPIRAFQGDGRRYWVLAVQLYAVRSRRNWGHGDFGDLARLIPLAASRGAAGIGLNPLHALFPDRAHEASPYAPNSRIFLNPLYIDVEAIPEFPGAATAGVALDALRTGDLIDYAGVARAKLDGLLLAYEHFVTSAGADRRADFERYRQEQGERLTSFSSFEVLRARFAPKPWPEWPEPWRHPARANLKELRQAPRASCEFHEFVQWIADRQLQVCKKTAHRCGMPVGLYVDVAVGIHPHGADAWSQQDSVLADVLVGAPPDEFNRAGQDWGLAPTNPHALAASAFEPLRELMKSAMRHAGAIRLDHVLGLKRAFMIPHGCAAADGAYVRFPFEPSLQAIAQESQDARCIVIGEDLGTVPEGFRETLARWGFWTYRVVLFEREGDGRFRPPEAYPAEALATFNTHDLPSLRGWLEAHDLRAKRALGIDPGESDKARAWAQQCLRTMLGERAPANDRDELAAISSFLAQTPSRLVAIALDDIMGALDQINIPGTVDEHPNWRRKLPIMFEDLERNEALRRIADVFARSGRSCH
ncbi:MAG: 4-alpha-glucanotransferase [Rhizomicrobium sp.]|jgi:4-alpha-glucanotransferase